MNIQQVTMTPEWARDLLRNNGHNRSCRKMLVDQIRKDIEDGRWFLTPQTVSVAENGQLLDGQHRLMAIANSGIAVQLMLATGCDPSCFRAIDSGVSRSAGDILKIDGAGGGNDSTAAVIRMVLLYRNYPNLVWEGCRSYVTKQLVLDTYRQDVDRFDDVCRYVHGKQNTRSIRSRGSADATFLYLYSSDMAPGEEDAELSLQYYSLFCSGEMLGPSNVILAFRKWLFNNSNTASVKKSQLQLACHIKAYKLWKARTPIKCFKSPACPPMPSL
jgi:hypothetical protein